MAESNVPLFAFVDETGNTGHNIFDEIQPDFYTAALISRGNFDTHFGDRVKVIASGSDTLRSTERRPAAYRGDILDLLIAAKANFFVARVEKKCLLDSKRP